MPTRATCYLFINNSNRLTKGKQVLSLHCHAIFYEDILQNLIIYVIIYYRIYPLCPVMIYYRIYPFYCPQSIVLYI